MVPCTFLLGSFWVPHGTNKWFTTVHIQRARATHRILCVFLRRCFGLYYHGYDILSYIDPDGRHPLTLREIPYLPLKIGKNLQTCRGWFFDRSTSSVRRLKPVDNHRKTLRVILNTLLHVNFFPLYWFKHSII